jgi:hypothetical protein
MSSVKLTNKFNIPLPIAIWLATDSYEHSEDTKTISATGLLKPIKSIILGQRCTSGEIDISSLLQSKMGTAFHSALENSWEPSNVIKVMKLLNYPNQVINNIKINPESVTNKDIPIYLEKRSNKEIDGWNITGQFDFISDGMLYDLKSTGTFSYINQSNKDKYIQQGSIYKWLNPDIVKSDILTIIYLFTDWSSTKAKQDKNYPQSRLLPQEYVLMSYQDTERFIKQKIKQIEAYKDASQESIPQCTSEELWERPSVFKYYKNPEKLDRSTKNFDSYWEANQKYTEDGSVGRIIEVKGEVVFCKYCSAREICNQAKQYIQEGRLIL